MGIEAECKEVLTGEISENELGAYFREMLINHGKRINFSFGERPVINLFKGKGIIKTAESITDRTSLVVETDRLGEDPFALNGDLLVWRKVHVDGGNEISRTGFSGQYEPYVVVSRRSNTCFLSVRQDIAYGDSKTIGYFPEVKELLETWFEGRKLPVGW